MQKLNRMRALQARGAQVTAEEQEIMDQLELALKETDASDDKIGGVKRGRRAVKTRAVEGIW